MTTVSVALRIGKIVLLVILYNVVAAELVKIHHTAHIQDLDILK